MKKVLILKTLIVVANLVSSVFFCCFVKSDFTWSNNAPSCSQDISRYLWFFHSVLKMFSFSKLSQIFLIQSLNKKKNHPGLKTLMAPHWPLSLEMETGHTSRLLLVIDIISSRILGFLLIISATGTSPLHEVIGCIIGQCEVLKSLFLYWGRISSLKQVPIGHSFVHENSNNQSTCFLLDPVFEVTPLMCYTSSVQLRALSLFLGHGLQVHLSWSLLLSKCRARSSPSLPSEFPRAILPACLLYSLTFVFRTLQYKYPDSDCLFTIL